MISYLAIPIMTISSIPQIIKIIRSKSSCGISINMFYLTFISVFLLMLEAIKLKSLVLVLADSFSLLMLFINIILIHKYK